MGLFDELENAPEAPTEDAIRRNTARPSLEAPEVAPETPEEVMMVARTVRKQAQEEESMAFGNVNDLGLQFNNTVVKAAGAPVEMMEWALNRVAGTLFPDKYSYSRDHLIDGEWKPAFHNTVGSTKSIRTVTDALGQTSDETPDTYMGYTGATLGEGAAFLAGGAGLVQKTKQAGGVVGAISRNADDALRTKLGTVVAGETVAAGGAGIGRAYAEDNEYGETGSLVVEFTAGAFALLSAAGAKKVVLDPLTAKLKNMTQKEALEKLSKEEVAEVVAEGQRVIAKEQPAPKEAPATPKETPEGLTIYRAENVGQADDGLGLPFYTEDKTYADLYMGEGRVLKEAQIPENVVDIRQPEGRAKVRKWAETKIKDLEEAGHMDDFLRGAKNVLNEDSPEASARLLANLTLSINKQAGRGLSPSGVAERQFLTETGNSAMTMKEAGREIDEYSYAILPEKVKAPATPKDTPEAPEFTISIDNNPKYDGPNGIYSKVMGYKVRAKDGKDYYIETANNEQPLGNKFVVHEGSDMHGEWIGSYPTKKKAVEMLQSKKAEAPEAPATTATPKERLDYRFDVEDLTNKLYTEATGKKYKFKDGDRDLYLEMEAKAESILKNKEAPATPKDTPEPTPAPKLYHGTANKFDEFDLERSGDVQPSDWGDGIYFTDNPEHAKSFAEVAGGDIVMERVAPDVKFADGSKLLNDNDFMLAMDDGMGFTSPAEYLKERGFGGVKFKNPQGFTEYVVYDPKDIKKPTPAPKTPEVAPEDAIDASIAATKSILEGDRTGGKGARVTAEVKPHFKAVAVEMSDQFNAFAGAKNADDAMVSAKAILARIDRFIDFDRIIAKKDYAQGSELVANAGHTTPDSFKAGITAEANQRTADLQTLKNMLEDFTGGAKNADEAAEAATEMAKKLTPEEKLTAIRAHMESMGRSRSTGPLMSLFDGYFTTRTAMALNQVKTGLVGTYSATLKSWLTPLENTLNAIDGSLRVKDASVQRRLKYALSEVIATQEYLGTFKNHWRNLGMNMRNTFLETGDSQLLYKEAQAYKGQEGISQQHTNFFQRRNLARAARTEAYNNATNSADKLLKGFKKSILNNNVADAIPLIFKFGFGLIGSVEEVSLMALSRRAQRAKAMQSGIREGVEDLNQYVDDWMNDAFIEQGDGSMRINYDPKYADGFNEARYDHFRSLDIPASDIRVEAEQAFVAALNKVAETPNELGMLTKFVMMFRGVPTRVGAQLIAYAPPVAQYRALKVGTRKLASAAESRIGEGEVSFGKYASKIGELKADIKRQTKLLDDPNTSADVRKEAEALIAQSDEQIARLETYQRADDYRDIARAAVSTGLVLLGIDHGRKGITTGSQSDLTRDQKFDAQKVDGAPNDWKIRWNELELDFRYAEPFKGAYGMGASWGRRMLSKELGTLTPDQTVEQFFIDSYMDMILDMPAMQGGKSVSQAFSSNPETRSKAFTNLKRSAFPIPSELRNILKWDEEFVSDGTQGDSTQSAWRGAVGLEQDNYRLTLLGEPKKKEEQTLMGHLTPYGGRITVERTEIDNILLEDAMSFGTVSEIPTSVSGMQLKKFVHVDDYNGETLYSKFGKLITNTKIGGKTQQKALEKLIKTKAFKDAYKKGYSQNEQGTDVNEGIEMIKDIMSKYRAEARKILLETKAATDYVDSDGNNIYNILKEREDFSERPESLLESLNLK
jgi:hypothetical protein